MKSFSLHQLYSIIKVVFVLLIIIVFPINSYSDGYDQEIDKHKDLPHEWEINNPRLNIFVKSQELNDPDKMSIEVNNESIKENMSTNNNRNTEIYIDSLRIINSSYNTIFDSTAWTNILKKDSLYVAKVLEYERSKINYNMRIYDFQYLSSIIYFIITIILILVGISASIIQFNISLRSILNKSRETNENKDIINHEENNVNKSPTKLKLTFSSIEFESTILGIILLFMSFLFSLIYIIYIYPIN